MLCTVLLNCEQWFWKMVPSWQRVPWLLSLNLVLGWCFSGGGWWKQLWFIQFCRQISPEKRSQCSCSVSLVLPLLPHLFLLKEGAPSHLSVDSDSAPGSHCGPIKPFATRQPHGAGFTLHSYRTLLCFRMLQALSALRGLAPGAAHSGLAACPGCPTECLRWEWEGSLAVLVLKPSESWCCQV